MRKCAAGALAAFSRSPPPAVILGLDPRIRGGWRAVLKKAVRRAAWRVSQGQAAEALDRLK